LRNIVSEAVGDDDEAEFTVAELLLALSRQNFGAEADGFR
jgi:hypothetical protein